MDAIRFKNFMGMVNRGNTADHVLGRDKGKGVAVAPTVILNADTIEGVVTRRKKARKIVNIPNIHSLVKTSTDQIFAAADGVIYEISVGAESSRQLATYPGADNMPLAHVELDGKLYLSNARWNGVLDLATTTLGGWGIPKPTQPIVSAGAVGSMDPGWYQVIFVPVDSQGRACGHGTPGAVPLLEGQGSVIIANRPQNCEVWITEADGSQFYRAGKTDLVQSITTVEPYLYLHCEPPAPLDHIAWGFGRMWGAVKTALWWSQPFRPDLFRPAFDILALEAPITGIAVSRSGLFIGTSEDTWAWMGDVPQVDKANLRRVGGPMVPGSIAYVSGDELAIPEMGENIPIWWDGGTGGIVAGGVTGQVVPLTERAIRVNPAKTLLAPILAFRQSGYFRYITSITQSNGAVKMGDTVTCQVIRSGTVLEA